jgi:hypothetical protein
VDREERPDIDIDEEFVHHAAHESFEDESTAR